VGNVYRAAVKGYRGSEDVLACRMKRGGISFGKLLTAVQMLSEGGLLTEENDGGIWRIESLEASGKKIALEETPTAKNVGYINM
jgi:hypothetical protein